VLPVGGVRAKLLAAYRAGIRAVVLPEKNRRDLDELPPEVVSRLRFHFVENIGQVLEHALETRPQLVAGVGTAARLARGRSRRPVERRIAARS
jgi:ATP-dependent Lon protease